MPGYKEIMQILGFKSKNAVYKLINKLVEEGVVEKDSQGKVIPRMLESEIPLLGVVEAGLPSPAGQTVFDTVSIDGLLLRDPENSFILEVKGDSMIDAHIKEGDWIVVEKREDARPGDIVVAEVDGEWTLKYFRKSKNTSYLEPANKKYKPIYPKESLRIGAVVRAVIRKY